jgi:hypothetical protein
MKTIVTAALVAVSLSTAFAQEQAPKGPLVQLIDDLDAGRTHAQLTDSQKSQLDSDEAVLKDAREARLDGRTVDRRMVGGALKDIHTIVTGGSFAQEDQQKIDGDIQTLRSL